MQREGSDWGSAKQRPLPTSGRTTAARQQRGKPDGWAGRRTETVRQCPDSSGRILGTENRDREWQLEILGRTKKNVCMLME